MNFIILILSFILFFNYPVYSSDDESYVRIDTSRFLLKFSKSNYLLMDNLQNNHITLKKEFLINPDEEREEEYSYVSSFNLSEKVNSFDIGNGLIGIQISSFSSMTEGSAQAAAGRDIFLVYDPQKNVVNDKILEFGITKQRQRYMGCLSAKTSHFILADMDRNGLIDIGRIKEELKCEEISDPIRDMDVMTGPFFIQDSVECHSHLLF